MNKLGKFFNEILRTKSELVNAKTGKDFEDKLIGKLRNCDIFGLDKEDKEVKNILGYIKNDVIDKFGDEFVPISKYKLPKNFTEGTYIYQPFGSQQYPDFIIILGDYAYPLEIKYSQSKSINPMWNSNLPKGNGTYIFGSYGLKDVTFFFGKDILPMDERKKLIDFFEKVIKPKENKFREELKKDIDKGIYKFKFGFDIYIRRAYQQTKNINSNSILNLFDNEYRIKFEQNVIKYFK